MKCQESPRSGYGSPFRHSIPSFRVHSRQPKRSYLLSMVFFPCDSESWRAYRSGCSGVQVLRSAGMRRVCVRVSPAGTESFTAGTSSAFSPSSHAGTGASCTVLPERFNQPSTRPASWTAAFRAPSFRNRTLISRRPSDTRGWIYTSSMRTAGRRWRYTSCQMPSM